MEFLLDAFDSTIGQELGSIAILLLSSCTHADWLYNAVPLYEPNEVVHINICAKGYLVLIF